MRRQRPLTDGWLVKQLPPEIPAIETLTRDALAPDATWLAARMPAQVHDVLLAHGLIPDPHVGRNAAQMAWVGEHDWAYACSFASPPDVEGPVFIRFGGLDTLATAYLNGTPIGSFDNMFRTYTVDVRDCLNPVAQANVLVIIFRSPQRFVAQVDQPPEHIGVIARHAYLRKAANDFNTYLGARPNFVKVGVYRDVVLDIPGRGWIEDLVVRSELTPDLRHATIRVQVETAGAAAALDWLLIDPFGQAIAGRTLASGENGFTIDVDQPQLWWPWTHGTPHLYRLRVDLCQDGATRDRRTVSFGLRSVRAVLEDREIGEPRFRFDINGEPTFLRGACWAPVEGMTHCWHAERARHLLDLAQHAQMNILRVWGGGYVPPIEFYEACDRRGILIWQDFMFEYGMHPTGEPAFDASCRAEVEGVVRQLRKHPSALLWCGGNENHMGWDFRVGGEPAIGRELFEHVMPEVCARLDPTRLFHPSSPYGGRAPNWPLAGDWHDYTTLTLAHESSVPLFVSELGRASAPALSQMRRFLGEAELWPPGHDPAIRTPGRSAWPPMWQYRSVDGSWDKVGALESFCDPATPADLIRVLGTAHGEYLQRSVERYRRGVVDGTFTGRGPVSRRCWGNMIWRLNDPWPIIYFSVIDYYLAPKIAFYYLRRAYAPILVCFEHTPDRLAVWVVNDSPNPVAGVLEVRRLRFDGTVRGTLKTTAQVEPGQAQRILDTVDLGPISLREEVLQARFAEDPSGAAPVHEATDLLIGERYVHLPQATLRARMVDGVVEVTTDTFARQLVLEVPGASDAVVADNYFDLAPGQTRRVPIVERRGGREVHVRAYNAGTITLPLGSTGNHPSC